MAATVAFALVLYAPGYLLAYLADLFGFRQKSFAERTSWAILCSFAVMPIGSYLLGRAAGLGVVCAFTWLLLLGCVVAMIRARNTPAAGSGSWRRERYWIAGLLVGWCVFVAASLVDLQVGNKLYFSVVMFDQSYRVAFTDAVARTGVPPANPLYFAGHFEPMRYYYFWYVICATVMRITHVTARQAFTASSIWAGFGLVAVIALYTRYFFNGARRQFYLAVALLAVTGADLVPAIGSVLAQPALNGEMEWWSIDQFYSWQDSLLWVPHHTAALICCLLSFLLLWRTRATLSRTQRYVAIALAGVSFASAFGLSIYVAFGFAVLMVAWISRLLLQRRQGVRLCMRALTAGILSAALLVPFLRELVKSASGVVSAAPASHLFSLSVRRMIDPEMVTSLSLFASWSASHPVLLDQAMRLLLLLPGLALELGFYGVVLILLLLARRRIGWGMDEARETAIYLAVCGLVMVTFIRSSVISNNDFGYRAALLPQFFLLLLGADLLASWWVSDREPLLPKTRFRRNMLYGLIALGAAGTIYQAVMLRAFLPIEAARAGSGFNTLPGDALDARRAFAALDRVAPLSAVVAFNPVDPTIDRRGDVVPPFQFYTRSLLMDSNRQVLNAEPQCATQFGGDPHPCAAVQQSTEELYTMPTPSAAWAQEFCRRFGVEYLVVDHLDPAWKSSSGWINTLPVVAAQPGIRILQCDAMSTLHR